MSAFLNCFPTVGEQTLRALARYPDRTAFAWDGGSASYAAMLDLIGRMQAVFQRAGLARGERVALLTSNRAETWAAGTAAQCCGLCITWLHPMGSLEDQLDQIADFRLADAGGGCKGLSRARRRTHGAGRGPGTCLHD